MVKIDFTRVEVPVSFDGETRTYNVAKVLGNAMMYNGSILLDIGFEDLARTIYYSTGEVEVNDRYLAPMRTIIHEMNFVATIKRELIKRLNG